MFIHFPLIITIVQKICILYIKLVTVHIFNSLLLNSFTIDSLSVARSTKLLLAYALFISFYLSTLISRSISTGFSILILIRTSRIMKDNGGDKKASL